MSTTWLILLLLGVLVVVSLDGLWCACALAVGALVVAAWRYR